MIHLNHLTDLVAQFVFMKCLGDFTPLYCLFAIMLCYLYVVSYDAELFTPRVEEIGIEDARLRPVWGEGVYRVRLEVKKPAERGSWRVTMKAG